MAPWTLIGWRHPSAQGTMFDRRMGGSLYTYLRGRTMAVEACAVLQMRAVGWP